MRTAAFIVAAGLILTVGATAGAVTISSTDLVVLTGGNKYDVSSWGGGIVTFTGIDLTGLTGPLILKAGDDWKTGDLPLDIGWEKFPIQIQKVGVGGTQLYLQAFDKDGFSTKSSHTFNSGAVTGPFDIRVILVQNPLWTITPQYRIPTGSCVPGGDVSIGDLDVWHTFSYVGSYTSIYSFNLTALEAFAQLDTAASGSAWIGGASVAVIPEPLTMLGVFMGIGGLAGYIRRRNVPRGGK